MKRCTLLFSLCMMLSLPQLVMAQYRGMSRKPETFHFVFVSAGTGYSSLINNVNSAAIRGNIGATAGLGYEFRTMGFYSQVGAEFQLLNSSTSYASISDYEHVKDTQNPPQEITYRYSVNQTDMQQWYYLNVPVMLGYYHKGYYIGAGAKVGFPMGFSSTRVNGEYKTSGYYPAVGLWVDDTYPLPQAKDNFTTRTLNQNAVKANLRTQVSILFECGYDVLSTVQSRSTLCNVLKVGAYMECGVVGVNNVASNDPIVSLTHPTQDMRDATINPFFSSIDASATKAIPYHVGVKLTYLFGGSRTVRPGVLHQGCQCYEF